MPDTATDVKATDVRNGDVLTVEADDVEHNLQALLSWNPLMDLLTSLSRQVASQQRQLEKVNAELEAHRKYTEEVKRDLQAQIDLKATEKALTALGLEVTKEKVETSRRFDSVTNDMAVKLKRVDQRAEAQAAKIADLRAGLDNKAEAVTVQKLMIRVDACATSVELTSVNSELVSKIGDLREEHDQRHEAAEGVLAVHGERLDKQSRTLENLATRDELERAYDTLEKSIEGSKESIKKVHDGAVTRELDMQRKLESRQAASEEVAAKHWSHIQNVEALCRTKADRDMVQRGLDDGVEALARTDEKHTKRVDDLIASTNAHNDATDAYLTNLDERLTTEEATMLTKSTLVEAQELRDKIALCALRTETRELIDVIRQEVAARVRMMKERLDRTDHELMRQLEESYTTDKSDKFASIAQQLEAKAEKETVDKVSESSQQLFSELQALHVRTQTLGQGMKVVLGWFEGMADKVTGLQGKQQSLQHQIAAQKEETAMALNETTKATLSRVRSLVASEGGGSSGGGSSGGGRSSMPAAMPAQTGFKPAPPPVGAERSRPRTAGGGAGVMLKPGSVDADAANFDTASCLSDADGLGGMPPSHLAGAAGSALGAALGSPRLSLNSGLSRDLSKLGAGVGLDGGGRPSTAPFKTEPERRRHQLDKKRQELVESRLPRGGLDAPAVPRMSEPVREAGAGGSPDERLRFTQPLTSVPTPTKSGA